MRARVAAASDSAKKSVVRPARRRRRRREALWRSNVTRKNLKCLCRPQVCHRRRRLACCTATATRVHSRASNFHCILRPPRAHRAVHMHSLHTQRNACRRQQVPVYWFIREKINLISVKTLYPSKIKLLSNHNKLLRPYIWDSLNGGDRAIN